VLPVLPSLAASLNATHCQDVPDVLHRSRFPTRTWWHARSCSQVWTSSQSFPSCATGEGPSALAECDQQPFQILPRRRQDSLTIDFCQASQTEPLHAVPLLRLAKQGLDPDLALLIRLLVVLRLVVAPYSLHIRLIKIPPDTVPFLALAALGLEWAAATLSSLSLIQAVAMFVQG